MTTAQIATRLVELCRQGEYETAQKELYADDVISIEPHASPAFAKETKGLPAILEKGHKFEAMTEKVYSTTTSDPLVTENTIAFTLNMDIAMKGMGRSKMEELCVYQVKDGKIVSERSKLLILIHDGSDQNVRKLDEVRRLYTQRFGRKSILRASSEVWVAF